MDLTDADAETVKEAVNLVNTDLPLAHVIYSIDEENGKLGVHTRCDTVFTDELPQLEDLVKSLMEHFFMAHERLKQAFAFLKKRKEQPLN